MVKQREAYRLIIKEPAKTRVEQGLCPGCAKPKAEWKRRKDWTCCSTECTNAYKKLYMIFGWQDLRKRVIKARGAVCEQCGNNCLAEVRYRYAYSNALMDKTLEWLRTKENFLRFEPPWAYFTEQRIEVDHIKPIALGGDQWDERNLQVLCVACHKEKTKLDAVAIAAARRAEKLRQGNGSLSEF